PSIYTLSLHDALPISPIEVADEDRGFDWALAGATGYRICNFSLGRNLDGRVGRLVNSQARDVASGAVGEPRLNMESDWSGRLDEDRKSTRLNSSHVAI